MHFAILGAGFGNEGKGQTVHDLVGSDRLSTMSIRFSGSCFPGHTIFVPGRKSIFKHSCGTYASNTCRNNNSTHLTEDYYISPMEFIKELTSIRNKFRDHHSNWNECNMKCKIITPWDILLEKQILRISRSRLPEKFCTGYNEAKYRNANPEFELTAYDCWEKTTQAICRKLFDIKNYYIPHRLTELGIQRFDNDLYMCQINDGSVHKFISDISVFSDKFDFDQNHHSASKYDNVFYEGCSGILSEYENDNLSKVRSLWKKVTFGDIPLTVVYVSRCYTTRLDDGDLPFELDKPPYDIDPSQMEEHEQYFRYSYLNLDLIREAISKDKQAVVDGDMIRFTGLLTCKDHLGSHEIKYIENGQIHIAPTFEYLRQKYSEIVGGPVAYRGTLSERAAYYMLPEWLYTEADN